MKIKSITAFQINTKPSPKTAPRPSEPSKHARKMARHIFRYDRFKRDSNWTVPSSWNRPACIVEAEDGTWGFAPANHGRAVASVIDDFLGIRLAGERQERPPSQEHLAARRRGPDTNITRFQALLEDHDGVGAA